LFWTRLNFFGAFLRTATVSFDRSLLSDSEVIAGRKQIFRIAQVSNVISVIFMPIGKTTFILGTLTLEKISTLKKKYRSDIYVGYWHGVVVK